ncbi:MAG: isochorismate synthase [Proteobacteria bacterium]|nr:isochorismate synthase [Cystobacterineae bacterium]MCL2314758.1 isochorismate synthase [Pseudomonadota bacterium]
MSLFWGCSQKLDFDEGQVADLATVDFYCSKPGENFRLWARGRASNSMVGLRWSGEKPEGMPGPFWGGWVFDKQRPWPGFEKEVWCLPKQLMWQREGKCFACGFGSTREEAHLHLSQLKSGRQRAGVTASVLQAAVCRLGDIEQERQSWGRLVGAALKEMDKGRIQKLVLARQIHIGNEEVWNPAEVLRKLESRFEDCWVYCMRGEGGQFFIGATPEVLCRIRGRQMETEALAGTAGTGEDAALLHSEKDLREHRWVVEGIQRTLEPLSERVELVAPVGIRRLPNLIHLHTPIRVSLREGVWPLQVARAMHPSPAVAGIPREEAMCFLRAQEFFSRGWYAGALGWGNEAELTLFVTLRSARIHSKVAELFVGAGVVQGSSEGSEWWETEQKAQALLHALGIP